MYAIVKTGGKQYRVEPNAVMAVEKLAARTGDMVELEQVALVEQEGKVAVGSPWVQGAKVICRVLAHGRGPKVDVFTFKAKHNYKRKVGHRQPYTRLRVEQILVRED
jgi:large subunit ribosomal protein L21